MRAHDGNAPGSSVSFGEQGQHSNTVEVIHDDDIRFEQSEDTSSPNERSRTDLQDTMQEASYLSLSAMAERTDRRQQSNKGLSFITFLNAATAVSGSNPTNSLGVNLHSSSSMADFGQRWFAESARLNRKDTDDPFQRYCEYLQGSFPFMGNSELQEMYEDATQSHETGNVEQLATDSPEKLIITYLGIATGILLSPDYSYQEAAVTNLAGRAIKLMSRVFNDANDLVMVHCLTSLTIYSSFTSLGGSTWHLLGLALTRCIASGMHTTRIREADPDRDKKNKVRRAFGIIYMLDTYISMALDRPCSISHDDVLNLFPPTPEFELSDNNEVIFRYLVQHAQILRSIRHRNGENGLLCHSIDLRHWHEMSMMKNEGSVLHHSQLLSHGYMELLKCPSINLDPEHSLILGDAKRAFTTYLDLLEAHLNSQSGAASVFAAFYVFAIGISLIRLNTQAISDFETRATNPPIQGQNQYQALNILTVLSIRYSSVRSLRDIVAEYMVVARGLDHPARQERLRALVMGSDIFIPSHLRNVIFGG
ncbi:hypothetical protein GQ44DRAFT_726476 [Phaeosphaeriaceae sp. PMI808]|nr:hypothetical protein GQ44DRAFT_726476 [Phaeosphaeriaceae sp. PMI808]